MTSLEQAGVLVLARRLRSLSDRLMQDGIRIYREADIGFEPRWFPVYWWLSRSGPSAVTEIARGLGVTHPLVNQLAREMTAANLVAAYKDTRDKRRRVLALTSYGKSRLSLLGKVWDNVDSALKSVFDTNSPDELIRLLATMESHLDEKSFLDRYRECRQAMESVDNIQAKS